MANFMNRKFSPYKSYRLFPTIVLILVLSSCSTARRTIREPLKEQGPEFLFSNLKTNELKYNSFSARYTTSFTQQKNETSFSGQIRIKKDSLIWISISPVLGIEMARLLITNDSVKYMNRIDNYYFISDFNYINSLINSTLDFDMLQAFLTGNDFSFYENSSFKAGVDNQEYYLSTTNRRKLKKYVRNNQLINIPIQQIWLSPETFKISKVLVREAQQGGRKLEGTYQYLNNGDQLVPEKLSFNLETSENKNRVIVQYSKVNMVDSIAFPFRIPEKYRKSDKF
jgi:outer membrane lipoprotein-sorting protein